ncbi:MAG TPA: type II toxin-antitoxin system VapC family toxin [Alphaproteobacteria bacterium]|jgi:tRNA(fMet)-specific endonuclease VapC|nr:type II toxin-antitoxin system VapC family toxin [Alphaproteobacteria bacterium]
MNKYLIDTCVIIDLLRGKSKISPVIFEKGASINVITLSELYYGANKSNNFDKSMKQLGGLISDFDLEIIGLDENASKVFGKLKSDLETKGQRLDDMDLFIASTAISENMILVTSNTKHFVRIKNLTVISPSKDNLVLD